MKSLRKTGAPPVAARVCRSLAFVLALKDLTRAAILIPISETFLILTLAGS